MSTHLKHDQKSIDRLLRERAWDEAIAGAIDWSSSSFEPDSVQAPTRAVAWVASEAAEGDPRAVDTIVRIIGKGFADRGPAEITEAVERAATEAVATIGPRIVPLLLPLLDDDRWQVATHAMRALGTVGDASVVPRIADVYARTAEPEDPGAPFPMWKREVRSEASVACMRLFEADPEGFVRHGLTVGNRPARTMLHTAAMYVVVKLRPSARTYELRTLADELDPGSQ